MDFLYYMCLGCENGDGFVNYSCVVGLTNFIVVISISKQKSSQHVNKVQILLISGDYTSTYSNLKRRKIR